MAKKTMLSILGLFLILSLIPLISVSAGAGDNITHTLFLPGYEIDRGKDGFDRIRIEGFSTSGLHGEPTLPKKTYTFALPPGVDLSSLELEITNVKSEIIPGTYDIPPVSPLLPVNGASEDLNASSNLGNPRASSHQWVELLPPGAYRQWQAARVAFYPFKFDPSSGELSAVSEISIRLNFQTTGSPPPSVYLHPEVSQKASQIFTNYETARGWYESDLAPPPEPTYDLVIIGSKHIIPDSTVFDAFVSHKEDLGYSTLYIDEDDFVPLTGQSPNGYAERIRQWLIDHYLIHNIRYVLIIGDPDPEDEATPGVVTIGDIPMKMAWPRIDAVYNEEDDEAPTDYFYADLTGDWNADGDDCTTIPYSDCKFGEYEDDYLNAVGGVDLIPDVVVGRIPIDSRDYEALDLILQKIIDYEMELNPTWRENILLPMSFLNPTFDPSQASEQMLDDYLDPAGFSSYTMYMDGNVCAAADTSYPFDEELRAGTMVRDNWAANDYGLVNWSGHGGSSSVVVGYEDCYDGIMATSILMESGYASALDDDHPSFVFHGSCNNGTPEVESNLGTALLENGAIGTVSASRVSWFSTSEVYGDFDSSLTNFGIAYEFMRNLVEEKLPAGDALYDARSRLTPSNAQFFMQFFNFNLYGDPTVGLDSYGCSSVPLMPPNAYSTTGAYADRIRTSWGKTECANTYRLYHSTGNLFGPYDDFVGETNQLFMDYFPGDEENHYFKVYACNEVGCSVEGRLTPGGYALMPTILINEVTIGNVDTIELYNYGDTDIILEDYKITTWSDSIGSAVVHTMHAFNLQAGAYAVIDERIKGFCPINFICINKDLPWELSSPGAARLLDDDGYELDFVRWGGSPITPKRAESWTGGNPPTPFTNDDSLGRYPNGFDTNNGSDWCIQTPSLKAANSGCIYTQTGDNVGFYIPSKYRWYFKTNMVDGWSGVISMGWGGASELQPVVGDWDGDGVDTAGFYKPSQYKWLTKNDQLDGWAGVTSFNWGGTVELIPIAGDWDGDGDDTVGFYAPSVGEWFLKDDNTGGWSGYDLVFWGGAAGNIPVVGDWDGDGDDTIGFYVPSQNKWWLKNDLADGWTGVTGLSFGTSDPMEPVTGDWDGDSVDTVGGYTAAKWRWYLKDDLVSGWSNISYLRFSPTLPYEVFAGDWQ